MADELRVRSGRPGASQWSRRGRSSRRAVKQLVVILYEQVGVGELQRALDLRHQARHLEGLSRSAGESRFRVSMR